MTDQRRCKSLSTYQNERITAFIDPDKPDGERGRPVVPNALFDTDILHAKELIRMKLAEPVGWDPDGTEDPPLQAHHQISVQQLEADRRARKVPDDKSPKAKVEAPPAEAVTTVGQTTAKPVK